MEVIQKGVDSHHFKDGSYSLPSSYDDQDLEEMVTLRSVALKLEQSLRSAKSEHLSCGEVLLPPDLLSRVARDITRMAETEPCGLRGCLILLNFDLKSNQSSSAARKELHSSNSSLNSTSSSGSNGSNGSDKTDKPTGRTIGRVRCDPSTVTTFELHLTLKEDPTPWYSRLPQILRNWTKGGTIVVSPGYTIAKKKLYRSH